MYCISLQALMGFSFFTNVFLFLFPFVDNNALDDALPTNGLAQNESRIRVRNWLMLADQSILEKTYTDTTSGKLVDNYIYILFSKL